MKKCAILILFFLIMMGLYAQTSVIEVDAYQLALEYDENPYRADVKYKNKILTVTGIVENIVSTVSVRDRYYISFITPAYPVATDVFAYIHPSQHEKLAFISRGQIVTISGKCDGKWSFMVNILDSYIVE